jgi:peroxiredoxin
MRPWLLLGLAVLAAAGGCTPAQPPASTGIALIAAGNRVTAPPVTGELLGGGTFVLREHAGEVVVVNFWGSWCAPCVAEADDLEQTYQDMQPDRVSFLGVNVRDQRDGAARFIAAHQISYPSVFDPAGRLALGFAVPPTAIPSTILIDRQGRVAAVVPRAVQRFELEPVLADLAAEPGPALTTGTPRTTATPGGAGG